VPVAVFVWGQVSTMLMLWIGWILGGVLVLGWRGISGGVSPSWSSARRRLCRACPPRTGCDSQCGGVRIKVHEEWLRIGVIARGGGVVPMKSISRYFEKTE
jgi:hypothetical protein